MVSRRCGWRGSCGSTIRTIRPSRCFGDCWRKIRRTRERSSNSRSLCWTTITRRRPYRLLESFVQHAPSADLYDRLGDAYQQIQQPAKSEQAYRQAVAIEPDQAEHRRHLAQSLYEHGKYADALAEYQRLVDLEPDSANNHLRISEIYRRLRQFDKAEEQILVAKKMAPGNLEVIYNEAAVYEAEEHYDEAVRVLSNAVAEVKAESEFAPARTSFAGNSVSVARTALSRRAKLSRGHQYVSRKWCAWDRKRTFAPACSSSIPIAPTAIFLTPSMKRAKR